MAASALFPCLEKLARCRAASEVGGVAMDAVKMSFSCHVGAAIFLDAAASPMERTFFGVRAADIEEYEEHWRPLDRVFPAVLARAAPVHNWQVFREDQWQKDVAWNGYGRRHLIYHYMSAPIFGSHGQLIGVINLCRRPKDRPFDAAMLEMASAFSGFLSATLARVSGAATPIDKGFGDPLAPRELQVASLAAHGRNNVQIALELGIARETVKQTLRRVYRKLDVAGRAQMAATLAARGFLGAR
jgi:DNA-binding CsgD family transcriptional regulator